MALSAFHLSTKSMFEKKVLVNLLRFEIKSNFYNLRGCVVFRLNNPVFSF